LVHVVDNLNRKAEVAVLVPWRGARRELERLLRARAAVERTSRRDERRGDSLVPSLPLPIKDLCTNKVSRALHAAG